MAFGFDKNKNPSAMLFCQYVASVMPLFKKCCQPRVYFALLRLRSAPTFKKFFTLWYFVYAMGRKYVLVVFSEEYKTKFCKQKF